jgi:hypothetical protein
VLFAIVLVQTFVHSHGYYFEKKYNSTVFKSNCLPFYILASMDVFLKKRVASVLDVFGF